MPLNVALPAVVAGVVWGNSSLCPRGSQPSKTLQYPKTFDVQFAPVKMLESASRCLTLRRSLRLPSFAHGHTCACRALHCCERQINTSLACLDCLSLNILGPPRNLFKIIETSEIPTFVLLGPRTCFQQIEIFQSDFNYFGPQFVKCLNSNRFQFFQLYQLFGNPILQTIENS